MFAFQQEPFKTPEADQGGAYSFGESTLLGSALSLMFV